VKYSAEFSRISRIYCSVCAAWQQQDEGRVVPLPQTRGGISRWLKEDVQWRNLIIYNYVLTMASLPPKIWLRQDVVYINLLERKLFVLRGKNTPSTLFLCFLFVDETVIDMFSLSASEYAFFMPIDYHDVERERERERERENNEPEACHTLCHSFLSWTQLVIAQRVSHLLCHQLLVAHNITHTHTHTLPPWPPEAEPIVQQVCTKTGWVAAVSHSHRKESRTKRIKHSKRDAKIPHVHHMLHNDDSFSAPPT